MAKENDNKVNAGGELLEKEVMRISLFDSEDSEQMEVHYQSKGLCKASALQAIATILYDEFGMIPVPVPKTVSGGVIVCGGSKEDFEKFVASMKDEEDSNNGECEDSETKGEE